MSLLRRVSKREFNAHWILCRLLEKWLETSDLREQIKVISEEEALELSGDEWQQIEKNPVGYLLGMAPFQRDSGVSLELTFMRYMSHRMLSRGISRHNPRAAFEKAFYEAVQDIGVELPDDEQQRLLERLLADVSGK
jgi:hypothetical protein